MSGSTRKRRTELCRLDADSLAKHQLARLNQLLKKILPRNQFYAEKLAGLNTSLGSIDELESLPYTFKEEVVAAGAAPLVGNLTYDVDQYVRLHQTSGTRGRPLAILDTAEDWRWWIDCWQFVLDAAEITPEDRVMLAFSFGPFIGFWSAHDAAAVRGCLVVPGGGLNTVARLELLRTAKTTCLFATPSYCLHLAEVAAENNIDVTDLPLRSLVVAGEPGGSVPGFRQRIESTWNAKLVDHAGATEVGPWGFGDSHGEGLWVLESEFIAEFLSVETGQPADEGELSELVLTSLGRVGSPVIRYRTGDLVRPSWQTRRGRNFVFLEGGILGRSDDMMIVRGVNIFPSSVEQVLSSFPEVVEYRITATKKGEMDQLSVDVEDRLGEPQRIAEELRLRLGLKVQVKHVPLGSLPRFEAKGKRFIDLRQKS